MATATTTPGQLQISVVASKPLDTTATFLITARDYFGNLIDGSGIAIYPATGWTNNDDGTYTFTRNANGSGDATYTIVASAPGYPSVNQQLIVAQQTVAAGAPALAVTVALTSGTQATLTYTYAGTVTYTLNGGASSSPGASPWLVNRPAAGSAADQYVFTATGANGAVLSQTVSVLAQATASGGAISSTGSTQTSPFGYTTAAQADGIVALLNKLRLIAIADGKMT